MKFLVSMSEPKNVWVNKIMNTKKVSALFKLWQGGKEFDFIDQRY